ncbi:alpha/beta-hydrolase [Ramicandelaber brevisporus]|nr:alpha/beta-hydrolase [Ramicandelaber brevisporus]
MLTDTADTTVVASNDTAPLTDEKLALFKRYAAYAMSAYINQKGNKFTPVPQVKDEPSFADNKLLLSFTRALPTCDGFVVVSPTTKEIVVGFRGTSNLRGWVQDGFLIRSYWPNNVKGSEVHAGFLLTFDSVRNEVTAAVEKAVKDYPGYKVVFTGHSLGGALALIATTAIRPLLDSSVKVESYLYGAPRVGNKEFASYVNSLDVELYRINHRRDIVCRIPNDVVAYVHVNGEVWIEPTADKHIVCQKFLPLAGEDTKGINSIPFTMLSVVDHTLYYGYGVGIGDEILKSLQGGAAGGFNIVKAASQTNVGKIVATPFKSAFDVTSGITNIAKPVTTGVFGAFTLGKRN